MVKVRDRQSIFDITVQEFGQIDDVVKISSDNNVSISEVLETNKALNINANGLGNNDIKKKIIEQGLSLNNDALRAEDFSKWFLPSKDELNQMYINLHLYGVGNFADEDYWNSTEYDATYARVQNFSNGNQGWAGKEQLYNVRACRTFTMTLGFYSLRDTGPGGGLIFYISGTTYYEAFPSDQSSGYKWSNIIEKLLGTTSSDIGEGENNTNEIMAQSANYDDWFLPSKDELQKMKDNLYDEGVGGFTADCYYWSSYEIIATQAYSKRFLNNADFNQSKANLNYVRACRHFNAAVTTYSLRDTGPGGGLICYISGVNYYEAAPSDQSSSKAWSNITNQLIGTTLTAIGEGQNNTDEIMAQSGHADSSAKLCDDYSNNVSYTDGAAKLCDDLN